jgi:hypothetical protein
MFFGGLKGTVRLKWSHTKALYYQLIPPSPHHVRTLQRFIDTLVQLLAIRIILSEAFYLLHKAVGNGAMINFRICPIAQLIFQNQNVVFNCRQDGA